MSTIGFRLLCASLVAWLVGMSPAAAQNGLAAQVGETPRRAAIRFLTDSEFPPFHYYDEDGVLTGFDIDMARAICLELAAACDIKVRAWEDLLPALKRGEADAVVASLVITPQALTQADFTDRYYYTPAWFAGPRSAGPIETTAEGLEGKRIGIAKGTAHEAYMQAFFRAAKLEAFDTPERAREALAAGKVDLVFDDGIGLVFWINGTASHECCELKGGPFFDARYFGDGVGIAVSKTDAQLKGLINRALKRVRENGRYDELLLRYFPNRLY